MFVYSFLNWLFHKNKNNTVLSDTLQPRDIFNSENLPLSHIRLKQQSYPWTSGYHVIKYICVMYNQVIYDGYGGDDILPSAISSSILDKCNNDQITRTLLLDLIDLSTSLYHISLADSENPDLFTTEDIDTGDISDSNTNNDLTDDDDSDNDDITTKSIPRSTKYQKKIKELDQINSKCIPTPQEQDTLNNIKPYEVNQEDSGGGVYVAYKHDVDVLKVQQKNHLAIRTQYLFSDG